MDAATGQSVQICRQSSHESLAFTGAHFSDAVIVQDGPADKLDVEMPLTEGTLGRFADNGESFWQDFFEDDILFFGVFVRKSFFELIRLGTQPFIRQRQNRWLEGIDCRDNRRIQPKSLSMRIVEKCFKGKYHGNW